MGLPQWPSLRRNFLKFDDPILFILDIFMLLMLTPMIPFILPFLILEKLGKKNDKPKMGKENFDKDNYLEELFAKSDLKSKSKEKNGKGNKL